MQPTLLRQIANWLKPSGIFLASLGSGELADTREEWLGTQMFFNHYDADTKEKLVRDSGFSIERAKLVDPREIPVDCRATWWCNLIMPDRDL
jgi:hypothetical protein